MSSTQKKTSKTSKSLSNPQDTAAVSTKIIKVTTKMTGSKKSGKSLKAQHIDISMTQAEVSEDLSTHEASCCAGSGSAEALSSPDTFKEAKQEVSAGESATLPNRAVSEGAFEAQGLTAEGGQLERSAPPLDEFHEQRIDEALELTFPGSDPVSATHQITRIEVDPADLKALEDEESEHSSITDAKDSSRKKKQGDSALKKAQQPQPQSQKGLPEPASDYESQSAIQQDKEPSKIEEHARETRVFLSSQAASEAARQTPINGAAVHKHFHDNTHRHH